MPRVPGHDAQEFSSSFTLNSDESVVLQNLSLNVHTLRLKKNSLLFLLSIESSSESVEGSGGNAITFERSVFSEIHTLQICKTS